MFNFLKEKLKSWTSKISKKIAKEDYVEIPKKAEKKKPEPVSKAEKAKKESFFKKITAGISKVKISDKEFEIYAEELEMLLLENNVALEVAEKIIVELKLRIVGKEFSKKEIE